MISLTPDLAEICGIHAGDGYMRKRKNKFELEIGGHQEEKDYYDNHVIYLFKKVFGIKLVAKRYVKGTYGIITGNRKIVETLNKLGFPFGKKSLIVRVPKLILNSNDNLVYTRFLRGLLDTDGHIGFIKRASGKYCEFKMNFNYYPCITLTTISKNLSKDISFILNKLKINHLIYGTQPKNLRDSYVYRIYINGVERLEKWMELIGSKNQVKHSRYLIWKKFGFCPTHTNLQQRKDILKGELNIIDI
jgi:hypothetical protein